MSATVQWPGIPEEHAKPFVNVDYEENLFTALELQDFPEEDLETTHPNESEEDEEEGPIE